MLARLREEAERQGESGERKTAWTLGGTLRICVAAKRRDRPVRFDCRGWAR